MFAYVVFEMMWIIHRVIIAGLVLINTGYADADTTCGCKSNKYWSYTTAFYLAGAAYMIESGKKLDRSVN